MKPKISKARWRGLCVLICMLWVGVAAGQTTDVTLYVDHAHPAASNDNPGSLDRPLRTVQEAIGRAVGNKKSFRSTRVVVQPGTYREFVDFRTYTNFPGNDPNNATPIIVEAAYPGTVTISGSDVWDGWQKQGNQYVHNWPYNWGPAPNPWAGSRDIAEITLRREMVFVNGQLLRQVLTSGEMQAGTFRVDETADTVTLWPPLGVDMSKAKVEVAVRERVWWQEFEHHVTIRGFVFEHAAEPWSNIGGGARFSSSNHLLIEDCTFRWNNWIGLYTGESEKVTLRRIVANDNGGDGWGPWRAKNILMEDSETSYNNWRGDLSGFYSWSVGNKIESVHGLTLRRHRAVGNLSRGLWLDFDNTDILFDQVLLKHNLLDGIFIEANPGPITIQNSSFCENQGFAIFTANSEKVTLQGNKFLNNTLGGIHLTGENGGRWVTNWETNERIKLLEKDWVLTNNTIVGGNDYLIGTNLNTGDWSTFINTLTADGNTWYHASRAEVFQWTGNELLTFDQWRGRAGEGTHSTFSAPTQTDCDNETQHGSLPLDFRSDPVGTQRSIALNLNLVGARKAQLKLTAYDVDALEELKLYINGAEVTLPDGILANNATASDSTALDLLVLNNGINTITFELAHDLGGQGGGFRIDNAQITLFTSVAKETAAEIPDQFILRGNYPNPFHTTTQVVIDLKAHATVTLEVFDLLGRKVMAFSAQRMPPGREHILEVQAGALPSGVYLYRVTAEMPRGKWQDTGQFALIR